MEIYVKSLPRCNPQSLDNERCSGFNNKQINMFRLQLTSEETFSLLSCAASRSALVSCLGVYWREIAVREPKQHTNQMRGRFIAG